LLDSIDEHGMNTKSKAITLENC